MDLQTVIIPDERKAAALAALYNAATPQGLGFLHYKPGDMSEEEAAAHLAANTRQSFDYLMGRPLKVCLRDNEVDLWLYNRNNGAGAAQRALAGVL